MQNKFRIFGTGSLFAALGVLLLAASPKSGVFLNAADLFLSAANAQAAALVVLVMWFESEIRELGIIDDAARRLEKQRSKTLLWAAPAVLGLIPSAAGARMSTAVVKLLGSSTNADGLELAAVNFWFRHVLVFCSPLIPGTILACALTGTSPAAAAAMGAPVAASFIIFGWIFFIKPIKRTNHPAHHASSLLKPSDAFVFVLIAAAAAASLAGSLSFLALMPLPVAYAAALLAKRRGASTLAGALALNARDVRLLLEVVLLMWFGAACRASGAVESAAEAAASIGIHPMASIAAAAFAASLATGSSLPSAAIAAPLAASMLPGSSSAAFTMIFAGFTAQFLTPSHLCLPISAEYFGRSTASLALKILPALCASSLAGGSICAVYFAVESAAFS